MLLKNCMLLTALCLFAFSTNSFGQEKTGDQTTANEEFRLEIVNKQITETNFESKLEVAFESRTNPSVSVRVGTEVRAERIVVTLKNVFGDVRFRASLEKLINQINLRRPPSETK